MTETEKIDFEIQKLEMKLLATDIILEIMKECDVSFKNESQVTAREIVTKHLEKLIEK